MLWEITCFNGSLWQPKTNCTLTEALVMFCAETGFTEWDIQQVVNKH